MESYNASLTNAENAQNEAQQAIDTQKEKIFTCEKRFSKIVPIATPRHLR